MPIDTALSVDQASWARERREPRFCRVRIVGSQLMETGRTAKEPRARSAADSVIAALLENVKSNFGETFETGEAILASRFERSATARRR
jgi:hypothetical protein